MTKYKEGVRPLLLYSCTNSSIGDTYPGNHFIFAYVRIAVCIFIIDYFPAQENKSLLFLCQEKGAFLEHNTLVLQVSGRFTIETASERFSIEQGEMLLIHRNQLGELTKTLLNGHILLSALLFYRKRRIG